VNVLVVLRLASIRERLDRSSEGSHAISNVTRLILGYCELNLTEHKGIIKLCRFCVVLRCLSEITHDE